MKLLHLLLHLLLLLLLLLHHLLLLLLPLSSWAMQQVPLLCKRGRWLWWHQPIAANMLHRCWGLEGRKLLCML